jgi:hypothetical protein
VAKPLNARLFKQLERLFGHVRISNQGQAMISSYKKDFFSGRDQLQVEYPGEYYQVCCPRCSDTRFRLYINHCWGHRDERGRRNLWLAICYNEGCYSEHESRMELWEALTEVDSALDRGRIFTGTIVAEEDRCVELPGPCTPLHELPESHRANKYLASRFYNPELLSKFYGVCYCNDSHYYMARQRIVVPIHLAGKLRGFQARHVGDLDWKKDGAPPKWWTGPGTQRGQLLYNIDKAVGYETGVIVEGPGDVWGFGPMACALFGSTMTQQQQRMFAARFADHSAVVLLDPEEMEEDSTQLLISNLRKQITGGVAAVTLPAGSDPGSSDRMFLREFIYHQAKEQGVRVSYRRRS